MKKIGIHEDELNERHLNFFRGQVASETLHDPKSAESLAKMRYENYESRRRHKLRVIYKFLNDNRADCENYCRDQGLVSASLPVSPLHRHQNHQTLIPANNKERIDQMINSLMERDKDRFTQL